MVLRRATQRLAARQNHWNEILIEMIRIQKPNKHHSVLTTRAEKWSSAIKMSTAGTPGMKSIKSVIRQAPSRTSSRWFRKQQQISETISDDTKKSTGST